MAAVAMQGEPPVTGFYARIARWYDAEHRDKVDDLLFLERLIEARGSGPLLEVGCGTGRVLFHLAQRLEALHGIDSEEAMLAPARRRLASMPAAQRRGIRLIHGDVLQVEMDQRYRYVLLSYNCLMHFHTLEAQLALLRRLRPWLSSEGLLFIDLPNAGEAYAAQDSEALTPERSFIDPATGHLIMQQASSRLDRATQLMHTTWVYDEVDGDGVVHRTLAPVVFRHFFRSEVELLLRVGGFGVEARYGGYEQEPFEDGCERLIVLARPA